MSKNWIKNRREVVGISQEELAARLQRNGFDISRATVGHWEQDKYLPPLGNPQFCKIMADILLVSVKELLALAGYDLADKTHSNAAERAAWLIDQLPPEKQDLAVRLVEELAKT